MHRSYILIDTLVMIHHCNKILNNITISLQDHILINLIYKNYLNVYHMIMGYRVQKRKGNFPE